MEKGNKCAPCVNNCCGESKGCSYGSYTTHSLLRLVVILAVMLLVFFLGMQVGELQSEVSHARAGMYQKKMHNSGMPMMKMAPVEQSTDSQ